MLRGATGKGIGLGYASRPGINILGLWAIWSLSQLLSSATVV